MATEAADADSRVYKEGKEPMLPAHNHINTQSLPQLELTILSAGQKQLVKITVHCNERI